MILPDVNVLVNAFRTDAVDHATCRAWLLSALEGDSRYGISPQVLAAVARITTHPRIFAKPSEMPEVLRFCGALIDHPRSVVIVPGDRHWPIFERLVTATRCRGSRVSDAWFAALAIEADCEWVTLDRDYERFPGLRRSSPRLH